MFTLFSLSLSLSTLASNELINLVSILSDINYRQVYEKHTSNFDTTRDNDRLSLYLHVAHRHIYGPLNFMVICAHATLKIYFEILSYYLLPNPQPTEARRHQ